MYKIIRKVVASMIIGAVMCSLGGCAKKITVVDEIPSEYRQSIDNGEQSN